MGLGQSCSVPSFSDGVGENPTKSLPVSSDRNAVWTWIPFWIVLAAVYCVTGLLCAGISARIANVSWMFYIPSGISLLCSLLWGARVAPGVFLGELAMAILSHQPIPSALIMAAGNSIDAGLAGWWFHDRIGRRLEFDRLKDVMSLIVGEVFVLQPLSAIFGMAAIEISQPMSLGILIPTVSAWYTANLFAQFVMAPLGLVWISGIKWTISRPQARELAAVIVMTVVVGFLGPGRWANYGLSLPVTFVLLFPLLVWASVRFPPVVAVTVGSVLGLFAFDACLIGAGPFAAITSGDRMLSLNVFMAVTIASALFLAAALGDSRRFEDEQARLITELQAASAEVSRLKELVTFCAWTGRVRWKGEWVSVERFLHERYNVKITHGISEEAKREFLADVENENRRLREGGAPQGSSGSTPPIEPLA